MRQLLHRLKFVYKKAKTIPGKANAELQKWISLSGQDRPLDLTKIIADDIIFQYLFHEKKSYVQI